MRGTQHRICPKTSVDQEPRQSGSTVVHLVPGPSDKPSDATTPPSNGSRRQMPSDGPITFVSADPTRCDLAGRTHSLCNGDGQRPNPDLLLAMPGRFRLTPSH